MVMRSTSRERSCRCAAREDWIANLFKITSNLRHSFSSLRRATIASQVTFCNIILSRSTTFTLFSCSHFKMTAEKHHKYIQFRQFCNSRILKFTHFGIQFKYTFNIFGSKYLFIHCVKIVLDFTFNESTCSKFFKQMNIC